MVLELRRDDDVAGPEIVEAPGVGDEIEPLGSVPDEDHLTRGRSVDQGAHLLAGTFVARGRPLAELVDGTMDVRVGRLVERAHRIKHLPGLLRGVRRVEVGKRLAVSLGLENGEVETYATGVECGDGRNLGHGFMVPGGPSHARAAGRTG